MSDLLSPNRRILLVDDNPAIHDDFRRVLLRDDSALHDLDADAAALFGEEEKSEHVEEVKFELDSAHQGEEALSLVKAAQEAGKPYAMAFVDMRMPPGWDGLRTIEEIWKVDHGIQIVICTAFSDRSWNEIQNTLTARDRWLVVKKPFDQIEVLQLAHALTKKWDMTKVAVLRQNALEQMVAARTEQLSAALQTNSDFLNNASHEMLTPMNGVFGMLQLLADTDLDAEQSEFVETATTSANHLLGLLKQILAYNKAGAAEIEPEITSVDLQDWIPRVIGESLQAKMAEKGLELAIEIDESLGSSVNFAANIVEKVLGLLLDNAVKFTQSGSVAVKIGQTDGSHSDIRFIVSDTGLGLTPEQLKLVEIPFAQVDGSLARENTGIGIGLPLVRSLLGLMGSDLEIDSLPGEGTRASFTVTAASDEVALKATPQGIWQATSLESSHAEADN